MSERTYVVTGVTDGIGRFTAEKLAEAGCTVVLVGRGEEQDWSLKPKVLTVMEEIMEHFPEAKLDGFSAELSKMEEVRELAEGISSRHPVIHGVLHNAAAFGGPTMGGGYWQTKDGFEHTMAVNVMAPHLLTSLLMPNVERSGAGRFAYSASGFMGFGEGLDDIHSETREWRSNHEQYALSKLVGSLMFAEMHERYGNSPKLTFHSFDTGIVDTKIARAGAPWARGRTFQRKLMWRSKRDRRGKMVTNGGKNSPDEPFCFHRKSKTSWMQMANYMVRGMLQSVKSSAQSFRALTHADLQTRSGTTPESMPEQFLFDADLRARLWDEIAEATGAEWPEPQSDREREPLPGAGEGQEALSLRWGEADDEVSGLKLRAGDLESSELEQGPMRLGSFTAGVRGTKIPLAPTKVKPWQPYSTPYNGTVVEVGPNGAYAFVEQDVIWNDGTEEGLVLVMPVDMWADRPWLRHKSKVPPEGSRVTFQRLKGFYPVGDPEKYLRVKWHGVKVNVTKWADQAEPAQEFVAENELA